MPARVECIANRMWTGYPCLIGLVVAVVRMLRGARWGILCAFLAAPGHAGEPVRSTGLIHEVKIGALLHDSPYAWSGFNVEPYSVDLNVEAILGPSVALWGGRVRPAIGATINFGGYTSKAYVDARWQREFKDNTFFAMGLGIAVHNGELVTSDPDYKELGRRVLFHPHFEWGYRIDPHNSVSLFYDHVSNASTADKNQGLDTIGVRYGYRF
jgi:hypothetical protein